MYVGIYVPIEDFYYVIHAEGSITFLEIEQNIND